jgi:outer membrane protein OmpA-like peptidoglycan-associated protein
VNVPHRLTLAVLALALVACDSSTDPEKSAPEYQLSDAFPPEVAEFIDEGTAGRLRFDGLEFEYEQAELDDADREILDGFAEVFEQFPGARILVEAHTDSRGSESFNMTLSQQRAEAVREYLIESVGAPGPYIEAVGLGEAVPLEDNATRNGRARNRRVEIVVTYRTEAMTRFILEAGQLDVSLDCDANPEPGVKQPGDFYITLSVRVSNRDGFYPVKEIVRHLVQANDGESFDLDLMVDAPVLHVPGDIIEVYVGIDEFDGGTSYSFRRSQLFQFEYDPELGCWGRLGEKACGVVDGSTIIVRDAEVGGAPCEMTFDWTLRLVDVP